ncbi:MAG: tyrosine-type recombinase/integrase [Candidatus Scalindua sp.]
MNRNFRSINNYSTKFLLYIKIENESTGFLNEAKRKKISDMELAYSSALRPREIYNLKITDIDFKTGLIFIEQSKNQKDRIVPVGKTAVTSIKWI